MLCLHAVIFTSSVQEYCTEQPETSSSGFPHWHSPLSHLHLPPKEALSCGVTHAGMLLSWAVYIHRHAQHGSAPPPTSSSLDWLTAAGVNRSCCSQPSLWKWGERTEDLQMGTVLNWRRTQVFRRWGGGQKPGVFFYLIAYNALE